MGRIDRGIPFGAPRGGLTDLFFLVLSTDDRGHLRVLARLSRLLGDAELLAELRAAPDPFSAQRALAEREERLA